MQPCTGSDEKCKRLYIANSVHYLSLIHDTKPTKYTNFLRYIDYSITLNILTCFDPQGIIFREPYQSNTGCYQFSHFSTHVPLCKKSFVKYVGCLRDSKNVRCTYTTSLQSLVSALHKYLALLYYVKCV